MSSVSSSLFPAAVRWVWPTALPESVNQYVEIAHDFTVAPGAGECQLAVAADAKYAVWLNGVLLGAGPYTDWPGTRSVDQWPLGRSLRPGVNRLAILLHRIGENHASYVTGAPGVAYAVTTASGQSVATSGAESARWRLAPAYRQGPMTRLTNQLPFSFAYDAALADDWREPAAVATADWQPFRAADGQTVEQTGRRFRERPFPADEIRDRLPTTITAQGLFKRAESAPTLAARMQQDWLSARTPLELFMNQPSAPVPATEVALRTELLPTDGGAYLILDLGRESVGFLELELTAAAGTQVEIAFGEHLDDLRVRSLIGARNFAHAYRCRQGRQSFTYPITRIGARYLQLHLSAASGSFVLHYAGLREVACPVVERGAFHSPDRLQNQIRATCVDTLRLCMHEHYEDCPWREQGLYANDSLNQALVGYYVFGEYRYPQVSFELLGDGLKDDGQLELCAPADLPITIPGFTMAWIVALEHNFRFSGDREFAAAMLPKVHAILTTWLSQRQDGLLPCQQGARYWHFYDWTAGGLDGTAAGDCTRFEVLETIRYDAPLNAFFILGLEAGAMLAAALGEAAIAQCWTQAASELRARFHGAFWQPASKLYATYLDAAGLRGAPSELVQALALCADCCPAAESATLRRRLLAPDNGLIIPTLSQCLYKFEALLREPELAPAVLEQIATDWGGMLFQGATSFWETLKGGWDFDAAGSLCHGWSTIPAYIYGAYLLGIRPLKPGFREFSVGPVPPSAVGASGQIPTPIGPIQVAWSRRGDALVATLSCPPGLVPVPAPGIILERETGCYE